MKNTNKYTRNYFLPPVSQMKWAKQDYIKEPPIWCSVDLRDGNQALVVPMSLQQKVDFFKLLVEVGFKEIEVGFPAASETEYTFVRTLIEQNMIPDDVTIQVLTQARPHIIEKTFESLKGAKSAIVHVYNSVSVAQREQVFKKSKEEVKQIAINGAKLLQEYAQSTEGNFRFQYSPESFTGTEMEYALEVCNAVLDIWKPTADNKVIINLPVTVSHSMPHVYASQVEYMSDNLKYRENVIISLHPHNDRGCAIADAEMGVLAGANRIEGTLFGNGERTGNLDIMTMALNMFAQGVDPKLNFEDISRISELYEEYTDMSVPDRHPYAGKLVFAAFSGSHQDAIAKGMKWREDNNCEYWTVPYIVIDPKDIGRKYDKDVIRINSQSGKGGIGYLMEEKYGYTIPPKMREDFGYMIKSISDHKHKELSIEEIFDIFNESFVNLRTPLSINKYRFDQNGVFKVAIKVEVNGEEQEWHGEGNGQLDAISHAIQENLNIEYSDLIYTEHALEQGSKSNAVAYIGIKDKNNNRFWGVGVHTDILTASARSLVSAVNKMILNNK